LQKSLIIILLILANSCSQKLIISENNYISDNNTVQDIINKIKKNNINKEGFFIEKANISIKTINGSKKFLLNSKFQIPDKYLFSIKSSTGIEGERIYIEKDTLLLNDRNEKKLLFGKPKDLEKVSGIPYFIFKRIFGDLISEESSEIISLEKINNQIVFIQKSEEGIWKSVLNPKIEKVKSTEFSKNIGREKIEIIYSKFKKEGKHIPENIEYNDVNEGINIKIRILKIIIPWDGEVEFIPGKGYIKEEIK
jgi:Domain of unknown function (DUF4292)